MLLPLNAKGTFVPLLFVFPRVSYVLTMTAKSAKRLVCFVGFIVVIIEAGATVFFRRGLLPLQHLISSTTDLRVCLCFYNVSSLSSHHALSCEGL